MPEVEKYKYSMVSIEDLLNEEVVSELKRSGKNIFPVSLVLINEEGEGKEKKACPIILSHVNNEEVIKKILHLDSPNSELLTIFGKILKKVGGK